LPVSGRKEVCDGNVIRKGKNQRSFNIEVHFRHQILAGGKKGEGQQACLSTTSEEKEKRRGEGEFSRRAKIRNCEEKKGADN